MRKCAVEAASTMQGARLGVLVQVLAMLPQPVLKAALLLIRYACVGGSVVGWGRIGAFPCVFIEGVG